LITNGLLGLEIQIPTLPLKFALPTTLSLLDGQVVQIPTLPALTIVMAAFAVVTFELSATELFANIRSPKPLDPVLLKNTPHLAYCQGTPVTPKRIPA